MKTFAHTFKYNGKWYKVSIKRIVCNQIHCTQTMTWFDIHNEFIKNFEKVNQLQKDYIINLERINYLYNESIKSIERVNELYKSTLEITRK
jgi:hypothetical protein